MTAHKAAGLWMPESLGGLSMMPGEENAAFWRDLENDPFTSCVN